MGVYMFILILFWATVILYSFSIILIDTNLFYFFLFFCFISLFFIFFSFPPFFSPFFPLFFFFFLLFFSFFERVYLYFFRRQVSNFATTDWTAEMDSIRIAEKWVKEDGFFRLHWQLIFTLPQFLKNVHLYM